MARDMRRSRVGTEEVIAALRYAVAQRLEGCTVEGERLCVNQYPQVCFHLPVCSDEHTEEEGFIMSCSNRGWYFTDPDIIDSIAATVLHCLSKGSKYGLYKGSKHDVNDCLDCPAPYRRNKC